MKIRIKDRRSGRLCKQPTLFRPPPGTVAPLPLTPARGNSRWPPPGSVTMQGSQSTNTTRPVSQCQPRSND